MPAADQTPNLSPRDVLTLQLTRAELEVARQSVGFQQDQGIFEDDEADTARSAWGKLLAAEEAPTSEPVDDTAGLKALVKALFGVARYHDPESWLTREQIAVAEAIYLAKK